MTASSPYSDVVALTANPKIGFDKAGALNKFMDPVFYGPDQQLKALILMEKKLLTSLMRGQLTAILDFQDGSQ